MFQFENDYTLENHRVRLSPLMQHHIDPLFEVSQNPEIWKYFTEAGMGRENFERYCTNAFKQRKKRSEYPLVIFDKAPKAYVGLTRIYDINSGLGNAKIGHTWIGRASQGTGLNKNCKFLLFEFLFDTLNFKRVGFGASAENTRSIHAMKSVGCSQEGVLRSFLPNLTKTGRADIVLMSMLQEEWEESAKRNLLKKIENMQK
ncbi:MAG: GNAT family protein [Bacteroidota bacterium]